MAATVANVSALLLSPTTTTTNTSANKLSDRDGIAADGLGGGGTGGFAKHLDEAKWVSVHKPEGEGPPTVTVGGGSLRKRPPRPPRSVALSKTTSADSQDEGEAAAAADHPGAPDGTGQTLDGEADSDPVGEPDALEGDDQQPAVAHESEAATPPSASSLAGLTAVINPPATGVSKPSKADGPEPQAPQRAPVQSVVTAENAAEEISDVPATAPPSAVAQSKAQAAASAFEKSLTAALAGPRSAIAAASPQQPTGQDAAPEPGVKPAKPIGPQVQQPQLAAEAVNASADLQATMDAGDDHKEAKPPGEDLEKLGQIAAHGAVQPQPHAMMRDGGIAKSPQPPVPAEARFAETNHANIVSGVRTTLLPRGGSMQIRLDPPELGALQVTVEMRDGAMTATFQTSNDDATRLLSHSLGQLKTALESQGVTVQKIQVQQAPKDHQATNYEDQSRQHQRDDANARQEQQRREMLRRMWRRISGGVDPVDLVA